MKYLYKFLDLPRSDKYLLIKVTLLLGAIRIALLLFRFSTVQEILARMSEQSRITRVEGGLNYQKRVVWAVKAAGRRLLGDKSCLPQALAVHALFQQAGKTTVLHIGVAKDTEDQLLAHAWVEFDGEIIIGGRFSRMVYKPLQPIENDGHNRRDPRCL